MAPSPPRSRPDRPVLAAVVPAYNASGLIAEAVTSLLEQSEPLDEIIVVDDGSRDNTAEVASALGVRVIRQENGGPGAARNTGIRASQADWIFLLDADDLALPGRVAAQLPFLSDPATAIVCARPVSGLSHAISFDRMWQKNQVQTSTVCMRRSAWAAVGGFDESRSLIGVEDYNLWLRLLRAGWGIQSLDAKVSEYRPTAQSLTAQVERFVLAELANVGSLAERLALPVAMVEAKEQAIYLEYGMDMFHDRRLDVARRYFEAASERGRIPWKHRARLLLSKVPPLTRLLP